MTTLLIIATYILGCVLTYLLIKKTLRLVDDEWTKRDRRKAIPLCICSWIALLAVALAYYQIKADNDDEPAKW